MFITILMTSFYMHISVVTLPSLDAISVVSIRLNLVWIYQQELHVMSTASFSSIIPDILLHTHILSY